MGITATDKLFRFSLSSYFSSLQGRRLTEFVWEVEDRAIQYLNERLTWVFIRYLCNLPSFKLLHLMCTDRDVREKEDYKHIIIRTLLKKRAIF